MHSTNNFCEPILAAILSIPVTLAANINDDWLIGIVGACFMGGTAFCVWSWRQIKSLSLTVLRLETEAATVAPAISIAQLVAQLAQSCPARANNHCPHGETVDIAVGQLHQLLGHERR